MDLGTVSQRLESNYYSSASSVADDICLVWHNCQTFNEPGSDVYQSCDELSRLFDQQWKQAKLPAPTVRPTNHVLNLQTPVSLPDIFGVIVPFLLRSLLFSQPSRHVYQSCDELSAFFDQQWKQAKLPPLNTKSVHHAMLLEGLS